MTTIFLFVTLFQLCERVTAWRACMTWLDTNSIQMLALVHLLQVKRAKESQQIHQLFKILTTHFLLSGRRMFILSHIILTAEQMLRAIPQHSNVQICLLRFLTQQRMANILQVGIWTPSSQNASQRLTPAHSKTLNCGQDSVKVHSCLIWWAVPPILCVRQTHRFREILKFHKHTMASLLLSFKTLLSKIVPM